MSALRIFVERVFTAAAFIRYQRAESYHAKKGASMASTIDELTINYEEDGILIVKELDKVVLTKGAWSTIIFKYQEWDRKKETYSASKFTIRRYRKMHDEYRQQSKFTISSLDQAQKIIDALTNWIAEDEQPE